MNCLLLHDIVGIAADDLQLTDAAEEDEEDELDETEEDNFDEEDIKAMLEENESCQGAVTDTANTDW